VFSDYDALVTVHGYNPSGMEGCRDPVEVWDDRLAKSHETVEFLEGLGAEVAITIPGGGDYDGMSEAELIAEYAEDNYPGLLEGTDLFLEHNSTSTTQNINHIYDLATDLEVDGVFTISSRDHAPRVLRDWQRALDGDEELFVAGVASDRNYTRSDFEPFIMEPAELEPFVRAFNEAWFIPEEHYEEAAEEVAETLRKYQRE
jgi:hypothetical protein